MASRIIPKTALRDRIREELAKLGDDTLVITDRGHPVAVAVSVERWNDLQERVEDLEDAVVILEHRSSPQRGRPADSVLSELEREHGPVRRSASGGEIYR
jgi:prevent-host-death family protein